jgi:NTP pyrophosphatase (non-canonical NTP hydrolase)
VNSKDFLDNLPRQSLLNFAFYQEEILKQNDRKHHWSNYSTKHLLKRLKDEVGELTRKIAKYSTGDTVCIKDTENVMKECADVSNFAMMIFDNLYEELYTNDKEET